MRKRPVFFLLALSLLALVGFSFDTIRARLGFLHPVVPVDQVLSANDEISLRMPIKLYPRTKMGDTLRMIHQRLAYGEPLSFKQVTDFMLWSQEDAFIESFFSENKADEENRAFLEDLIANSRKRFFSIVPMDLASLEPVQIKVELENALEDSFEGSPLMLSRDKANVLDLLTENRGQDYSLTMLYFMVARQMGQSAFEKRNFTVIFTEGRIYPGFIERDGEDLRLFAIDFHRKGKGGPIYFGKVRDLSNSIEVVDASQFLLANLFRGRVANTCELRNSIRAASYAKWNRAMMAPIEQNCRRNNAKFLVDMEARHAKLVQDPLNSSTRDGIRRPLREVGGALFAFGASKTLPGNSARLPGNVMRDFSVQYSSLEVEPVAELVESLNILQNVN